MSLTPGTRFGPYEIVSALGAGGMGEVYRATDTNLGRDVAIKILPEVFAQDPERVARFEREAKALASLNHPNIAIIHGLEKSQGTYALVMELVEGEDLSQRIARGPIALDEALPIAKQIAEALEAAHEQGIIHRDLKPANIKVRDDGTVKVLDFGLAKLAEPSAAAGTNPSPLSLSPTITSPALMTGVGVLLGTAAYMSPEQAKGKPADKRSDIWAFGCVVYEMLTGRRAFPGDGLSETLAAVIKSEPDWSALPATLPASARRLLSRCLEKDRKRRLADIADARLELDEASNAPTDDGTLRAAGTAPLRRLRRERIAWATGVLLLGLVAAFSLVVGFRSPPGQPELRVDISFPPNTDPESPTISPDGRRIAFVARTDRRSRVWIHTLDGRPAQPLDRTDGAQDRLFWSPDGRSVGFFAEGKLKRVDIDSGAVQALTDVVPTYIGGGAWNRDGVILFAPTRGPLFRVPQTGGVAAPVTRVETPYIRHVQPQFLPDGRHFLFYSFGADDLRGVYVGDLEGATAPERLLADVDAAYAALGHLFFARQGVLLAQRFDAEAMRLVGLPWQVAASIQTGGIGRTAAMTFSASESGTLVYASRNVGEVHRRLIWFDKSGKELRQLDGRDAVEASTIGALSPDGRWLAVDRRGSMWILDVARGGLTRFGNLGNFPLWAPLGDRLVFQSPIGRGVNGLSQGALTGGEAELLVATAGAAAPNDWSPDGRLLLYRDGGQQTGFDLWLLPVERETGSGRLRPAAGQRATPFANTAADEMNGQFSPDGAAIAYESDESGEWEIYLQPFGRPGVREQLSVAGGRYARWRRDGRELYYHALDGRLMMVPIRSSSPEGPRRAGDPVALFSVDVAEGPGQRPQFVVTNDGERFLVNTVSGTSPVEVTMIVNWSSTR